MSYRNKPEALRAHRMGICRYCGGKGLDHVHDDGSFHSNWHECTCRECYELRQNAPKGWVEVKQRVYPMAKKIQEALTRSELDRLNAEDAVLASDAERDAAVERLRAAAGEGRLTPEGLEARVSLALSAARRPALEALLRDLPEEQRALAAQEEAEAEEVELELLAAAVATVATVICLIVVIFAIAGVPW